MRSQSQVSQFILFCISKGLSTSTTTTIRLKESLELVKAKLVAHHEGLLTAAEKRLFKYSI